MTIQWEVMADRQSACGKVAAMIAEMIDDMQTCVLGLATGDTPMPVYQELVRRHRETGLSFANVISFNLDEYLDLPPSHEQSYRSYMQRQLFDQVDIEPARTHLPDTGASDVEAACERYEQLIASTGGIDLQLLGIGSNGHIGFNEPRSSQHSRTRVVRLADATIDANSRFFDSPMEVPRQAVSMGIATILEAKQIVLLATGESKRDAVMNAIHGPVSDTNPASYLQLHPNVTFIVDRQCGAPMINT